MLDKESMLDTLRTSFLALDFEPFPTTAEWPQKLYYAICKCLLRRQSCIGLGDFFFPSRSADLNLPRHQKDRELKDLMAATASRPHIQRVIRRILSESGREWLDLENLRVPLHRRHLK